MSEFRKNVVSGEWIIIAPERAKRPHDLLPKRPARRPTPKGACPFEDLERSGNGPVIDLLPGRKKGEWDAVVIPNKYPALRHEGKVCAAPGMRGPYEFLSGVGEHHLLITRDHATAFADLSPDRATGALLLLQRHFRRLAKDACVTYASAFFNYGPTAGASLFHPHFQVLGLPIVPPSVQHSLEGSRRYFAKHKECVHCMLAAYERKRKSGIVAENRGALAVASYTSREPFEVRIYPSRHVPRFEDASPRDVRDVVAVLQASLRKIRSALNDPDLNFFIHSAPVRPRGGHRHYHWHIEIIPKISMPAGFELSTGILINVVDPDAAARILRGGKAR